MNRALLKLVVFICIMFVAHNAEATITTCAGIQTTSGKTVTGGTAGFVSSGQQCFSGGGKSFCAGGPSFNHTYQCAGAAYVGSGKLNWPPFDPPQNLNPQDALAYFNMSTRDSNRGRAGHNVPLFMDAHGICRSVDNTAASVAPIFMGVSTEEEWRTVHGVPANGNPNAGYADYANYGSLPVAMDVCCAPITVNICGTNVSTGYANAGTVVSLMGNGGYAEYRCAGNNNFVPQYVTGICGGSGGGSASMSNPTGGYHNPNNGGTISASDWGGLSPGAQSSLSNSGYGPNSSVSTTNNQGAADKSAAEADVAAEEAKAKAAEQAEQAAIAKAKQDAQDEQNKQNNQNNNQP